MAKYTLWENTHI